MPVTAGEYVTAVHGMCLFITRTGRRFSKPLEYQPHMTENKQNYSVQDLRCRKCSNPYSYFLSGLRPRLVKPTLAEETLSIEATL